MCALPQLCMEFSRKSGFLFAEVGFVILILKEEIGNFDRVQKCS